ncbi:hypothetical protein [Mesorhizobium sangaii]|uniref:Uncharacterized protein n=1 Tax=Mesorhizobium sangaii TaxID=505389 RepID=A0A841PQB5_9HYPH|nr:hypothetical protein [Mesorhizobium sangaii]MBB6412820.1 hypothetical protein [Mesorhizobium sangaii]
MEQGIAINGSTTLLHMNLTPSWKAIAVRPVRSAACEATAWRPRAMGTVQFGCFFPLGRRRHASVPGSAVSAGIDPLDPAIIDALSWRDRIGKTHWFEFVAITGPLCLFTVLAGSTVDVVARSFLIFFAIYSDLVIVLLWFAEKDEARTEPTRSHPYPKRIVPCVNGQGDDHLQFLQPVDASEAHSRRCGRRRARQAGEWDG